MFAMSQIVAHGKESMFVLCPWSSTWQTPLAGTYPQRACNLRHSLSSHPHAPWQSPPHLPSPLRAPPAPCCATRPARPLPGLPPPPPQRTDPRREKEPPTAPFCATPATCLARRRCRHSAGSASGGAAPPHHLWPPSPTLGCPTPASTATAGRPCPHRRPPEKGRRKGRGEEGEEEEEEQQKEKGVAGCRARRVCPATPWRSSPQHREHHRPSLHTR